MRPAFSLIVFTTLSGLGFGLAAILGLGLIMAPTPQWWVIYNGVALALIGAGVLSSTLHLGHPERAWRAMTQWRSSWLSREGVLAALTTIILLGFAAEGYAEGHGNLKIGIAVALLSLATIWSTAMIYASLKTVARWHHPLTPFVFVGYAISGGLVLAAALDALANGGISLLAQPALMGLISTAIVTMIWTKQAGAEGSGSTPESATGLGNLGEVRMLMPPHSEENWLQHEMGFVVARKHAAKLRLFSVTLAIILPAVMVYSAAASSAMLILAAITHVIGVMVSRWLFFAEAKHTVMLYYGARH
jgi:DMSO reductase anchor subunit